MNRGFQVQSQYIWFEKNHFPKKCTDTSPQRRPQNWELSVMQVLFINLWTFVDLCSLSGAFSDLASNFFFWICLKLSFQRGFTLLHLKKLIICPFFMQGLGVLVARGTLKNSATKNIFVQKLFLSTRATFGKCTKKMKHFCKITSPPQIIDRRWHFHSTFLRNC